RTGVDSGGLPRGRAVARSAALTQPLLGQPDHFVDVVRVVVDVEGKPQQIAANAQAHAGGKEMLVELRHFAIAGGVVVVAEIGPDGDDVAAVRAGPAAVN